MQAFASPCTLLNTRSSRLSACTRRPRTRLVVHAVASGDAWQQRPPKAADATWDHEEASTSGGTTGGGGGGGGDSAAVVWETICGCETCLPAAGAPSGIVTFMGGLAAGGAPERFYRRLAQGVSGASGAAFVCVPLPALGGLDHGALSRRARARGDAAVSELRARYGASLRAVGAGHSLGARLQAIDATRGAYSAQADDAKLLLCFANGSGVGGFADMEAVATRARSAAGEAMRRAADAVGGSVGDTLRRSAQETESGEDRFEPSGEQLLEDVRLRWGVRRTLVIAFEKDTIDNSKELVDALRTAHGERVALYRKLPGTHITPMTPLLDGELASTGFERLDSVLRASKQQAESDVDGCIAVMAAFVKLLCEVEVLPPSSSSSE